MRLNDVCAVGCAVAASSGCVLPGAFSQLLLIAPPTQSSEGNR